MFKNTINFYAPRFPHDNVVIIADVAGLEFMAKAISEALTSPRAEGKFITFDESGEGYEFHIRNAQTTEE